ncbi:uncharacterized protein MYCFIDRAFT_42087 [Pseudocercospora fijiensis CIRAD86]|uniref:DUF7492 domain-containing protein n=1 Tax=Pseudocercospora fijiensis (strain CIRAD86) TaxID=383855 RepID=M3B6Q2_PSEFD|nr:uncharacterized protein MYCFIDRAFT_42087 [Pseudocercospora fijiensis CIRAD86]EME85018.1 hypothetical protein MYCFIDRAFT_42087 [Pseudocercospora fijiensis CIRAD86]
MTHLLPADGRASLNEDDRICKASQSIGNVTFPRLRADAGSTLVLRYREGGHISLSSRRPEKLSAGTVSVYGTSEPVADERIINVHLVWNANGTGGNSQGRLLARASFDDGICFENNGSPLSMLRQHKLPPESTPDTGGHVICTLMAPIPTGLRNGSLFTLYWVWDWPSIQPSTDELGKAELYTTCIDIEIG